MSCLSTALVSTLAVDPIPERGSAVRKHCPPKLDARRMLVDLCRIRFVWLDDGLLALARPVSCPSRLGHDGAQRGDRRYGQVKFKENRTLIWRRRKIAEGLWLWCSSPLSPRRGLPCAAMLARDLCAPSVEEAASRQIKLGLLELRCRRGSMGGWVCCR